MPEMNKSKRTANGFLVLVIGILAVLLSFLLRVPCRVPEWDAANRFPALCSTQLNPGDLTVTPGGMLEGFFTGGLTGDQPIVVGMFTSLLGWMTTGLAQALTIDLSANTVLDLTVVLTAMVWVVVIATVAGLSGKQPSDPVVMAFAPTVLLVGFTSWDLWAVMFMMLAVSSYIRGSPGIAGLWIGLGVTVNFLPLLVLLGILFMAARYRYIGDFFIALLAAFLVFAAVNGPFMATEFARWRERFMSSIDAPVQNSTLWDVWNSVLAGRTGFSIDPGAWGSLSPAVVLLAAVAVLLVTVLAGKDPSLVQVLLLLLIVVVLFGREWSLLQSVWMVPLVVLARRSWLEFFIWQAVEIGYWATLNAPAGSWETQPFFTQGSWSPQEIMAVARFLVLLWLLVVVIVDIQRGKRASMIGVHAKNV